MSDVCLLQAKSFNTHSSPLGVATITIWSREDFSSFQTEQDMHSHRRGLGGSQLSTSREREVSRSGGGEKHFQHGIGVVKSKLEAFLSGVVWYFLHT
jgi:hypothetical protein